MEQLVYSDTGYDLTTELLTTTRPDDSAQAQKTAANHAVFKLILEEHDNKLHGLRLEMAVDYKDKSGSETIDGEDVKCMSGYLKVSPTRKPDPSSKSALTCELPIRQDWTVDRIARTLIQAKMHNFDFVKRNGAYYGCRDFMCQAISLLHRQNFIQSEEILAVLTGPELPVSNIYHALGLHFTHNGLTQVSPIDKGHFPEFSRAESLEIPYKGSKKATAFE